VAANFATRADAREADLARGGNERSAAMLARREALDARRGDAFGTMVSSYLGMWTKLWGG